MIRWGLKPLTLIYGSAVSVRNWAYDSQWLTSSKVNVPVVSVGNLTMGGTGKTPFVDYLIEWCRGQEIKVGVVSRGYGGKYKGVVSVPVGGSVKVFGDEPCMLKWRNPDCPIYLGRKRVQAAVQIIESENVQLIIADDAFQHRGLYRDLNIVIIDATEPIDSYELIPLGRARERWSALSRADLVVLSKINLAKAEQVGRIKDCLLKVLTESMIIESEFRCTGVLSLVDEQKWEMNSRPLMLVSGVGRPENVRQTASELQLPVCDHLEYRDHHVYTPSDVARIEEHARRRGSVDILCTQKDAIKLKPLISKSSCRWWYLGMELRIKDGDLLYESLGRLAN